MRYYLMFVLGPAFGCFFFIIVIFFNSVAENGFSKSTEALIAHPEFFLFLLIPAYVFGLLPSFFGLWLFYLNN